VSGGSKTAPKKCLSHDLVWPLSEPYSLSVMAVGASQIGVLGPLRLELDGNVVPLSSGRQRSLLAVLVMSRGVPLTRDRLIDELWGEKPPASAVSALHVHLSKLREQLGGLLVLTAGGYSLSPDGYELDARRFEALLEQAAGDPPRAGLLLREALALYRGSPLSDVSSEGSVAQWRRELDEMCLRAFILRVESDLDAGAGGELVGELERLVAEHQFEERVWGQLMRALYRDGRTADALEAYQRARRLFARELGLEPGELLNQLQRRILENDPMLPASAAAALEVTGGVLSQLPRPLTRLVGRERELVRLAELMVDPEVRIVTLTGAGGVGKTRLALEAARSLEPRYAHGAVLVRLEQITDPALVAGEIAGALAHRDGSDGPSADGLAAHLRERELLLVIDNFEHLLAAAALIPELLTLAPGARALVSSRTALRVRGETVFEVEPLELPHGGEPQLSQNPAVQLFLQSMAAAERERVQDAATIGTVARICRALDGLPLAIELAASRARLLSPEEIAGQLERPLAIGEHGLRDLPDRQQTLDATIRWSYDLLTPDAQQALRHAALFRGGFTLPALESVTAAPVRPQVQELREASLIRRQSDDGRFELLELVRAFALGELDHGAEGPPARSRYRRYFAEFAAPAGAAFDSGGAPGELAAPMLADHANVRQALEDAIDAGDQESAVTLALGLRPLWLAGQLRQESQELTDRLLDRFSMPGESEVALLRAAAYLDYGPNASIWHRRVAARAAEIGDQDALVTARGNLFGQALNSRDLEEMRRLRPELLELITPDASPKALGWIHYFLALDAYVDGRFQAACDHASLSVANAETAGHEVMLASAAATRLLSESARDGVITLAALIDVLEAMRRPGIQPVSVFALWLVARYAAAVAPESAGRWLAHAERIVAGIDSQLWPESALREETLAVLGITDLGPLLDQTPPLDHISALAQAAAWVAEREPGERASRVVAGSLVSARSSPA
jgi:predicted ATPase/DNA-binding SARP family transcriptional activator